MNARRTMWDSWKAEPDKSRSDKDLCRSVMSGYEKKEVYPSRSPRLRFIPCSQDAVTPGHHRSLQRLVATRNCAGASPAHFPPLEQIRMDIDQTVAELTAVMAAPVLEHYSGPVLFDETAATQLFRTLLADGLAGRSRSGRSVGTRSTERTWKPSWACRSCPNRSRSGTIQKSPSQGTKF